MTGSAPRWFTEPRSCARESRVSVASEPISDMNRAPNRASALLGMVVFAAVLPAVHGDVTWYDAGELSVAAAGLGVAHPTGFPLFTLLGHLFASIPLGSIPFRLALLSACSVALATALIHAIAVTHGACPRRSALGALLFPATFVVWLHAGLVEVYAPNVACIALLAWLLLRHRPSLEVAAFLSGLGLGAHATFVLSALGLWSLVWTRERDARRILALWPWVLFGAVIILFLPAAASRDPWLNWGDPSSLAGLIDHLTAAGIRSSFADEMGVGVSANATALRRWADLVSGSSVWLLLLVLAGLLRDHRASLSRAALVLLALDLCFSVFLNPMGQADLQTGVPGAWALCLGAAMLVGDPRLLGTRRVLWTGVALLALVWVGSERIEDRAGDEAAGVWSRLTLGQAPPGALVLVSSDHLASQGLYLEGVEGFRPDLTILVKQHIPDDAFVRRRYHKEGEPLPEAIFEVPPEALERRVYGLAAMEIARRPVMWELGDGRLDGPVSDRLRPTGALYRLGGFRSPASSAEDADWLPSGVSRLAKQRPLAFRSRRVLSDGLRLRGVWHLLRQESDLGARVLEGAVSLDPTHAPSLLNLAAARFRQGDRPEAIELLERALIADPTYTKARENIQLYKEASPVEAP